MLAIESLPHPAKPSKRAVFLLQFEPSVDRAWQPSASCGASVLDGCSESFGFGNGGLGTLQHDFGAASVFGPDVDILMVSR